MTTATLPLVDTSRVVINLNALLRFEHAAAESYQQAIDKLGSDATGELFDCLYSHQLRCERLCERIQELHGVPMAREGSWAVFGEVISGASGHLDRLAVLSALRDGEAATLALYHEGVNTLDVESQRLVEQELLPEQHRTLQVMKSLFIVGP